MKVSMIALGCKVNQYESQVISELLIGRGFVPAASVEDADINIINSCTVTGEGDRKTRQMVRKYKRKMKRTNI